MVARVAKRPNAYFAHKVEPKTLENLLKGFLILVGKPLYFLLSRLIIALLFLFYLVGHTTRVFLLSVYRQVSSFLVAVPKTKLAPPKVPRFGFTTRIILLKIRLVLARIPPPPRKIKLPRIFLSTKLTAFIFLVLLLAFSFWYKVLRDLPSPSQLTNRDIEVSTKIYDRNGILLYKIYKNKNRTIVPLSKIPQNVRLATLAAEDAEFYGHPGFSIRGMIRASLKNLRTGEISGGSTITQQLVKNALLSPEKTLTRKIREIILSVEVELTYSKDQILEMYLNEVSYGGTAYGIEEAAQLYFGKDVDKLDLAEAALLAGLSKSPTKYSPFGTNPDLAIERQKEVLNLMKVNGFITAKEVEDAAKEKLVFAPNRTEIKAPHFVMYVRGELVDKYGEELVEKGGLDVVTSLDYSIQKMAEQVVKSEVENLRGFHVGNGAALVLDPESGEILAMVGSKDYFNTSAGGNVNVTVRPRQPGSSIKIVNYAYALSHNYTPASILDDSPVTFSVPGQPPYSPQNYDGQFRGKITLRSALAQSRNVPAVKVLASYGVANMVQLGKNMGITTWDDSSRFGLSLTLGGGDVKLLDLARVYATVADYGKRPNIVSILKVTDYKGKVLENNSCAECNTPQVIDPQVAYLLIDILKDNSARAPEFGTNSALVIPNHPEVAVKTGTSNNLKDNLTLGFNQKYLVATWVGNNDSSPMARIASGITGAAPIWNKIMQNLLSKETSRDWQVPSGLVRVSICPLTGTLACNGCPNRLEWFLSESAPTRTCSSDWLTQQEDATLKEGKILEPAIHYP